MTTHPATFVRHGAWLLIGAGAFGFLAAIFYYFSPGNGIAGTGGALLVVVSSFLVVAASLIVYPDRIGVAWLRIVVKVLIFLGLIGTAFAAYMLEARVLTGLTLLALVGFLVSLAPGSSRVPAKAEGNRELGATP